MSKFNTCIRVKMRFETATVETFQNEANETKIENITWIMWRVFDPERTRHWAPRAARDAYPVTAAKSRTFVQNRRFSKKKWAAKSRVFGQNRVFSSKIVAFQIRSEPQTRVFSSKSVAFQIRSEPQNRVFSSKIVAFQKRSEPQTCGSLLIWKSMISSISK